MKYTEFLNKVVDDGIEAAKKSYAKHPDKLRGSVAGFEACRGKSVEELRATLKTAARATEAARICRADNYWEVRCFEAEVEWACNVVSAALANQNVGIIVIPTAQGLIKAAGILDVRGKN